MDTDTGDIWCEWKDLITMERDFWLTLSQGFVVDLDPVASCLHVVRVSNAYPRIETRHTVSVEE